MSQLHNRRTFQERVNLSSVPDRVLAAPSWIRIYGNIPIREIAFPMASFGHVKPTSNSKFSAVFLAIYSEATTLSVNNGILQTAPQT